MTTPRERMLSAFAYSSPDRMPVYCIPSAAGLHVHRAKLAEKLRWLEPDNDCDLESIPSPPPDTVDASGRYCQRRRDEWGTHWEHRIFGVHGHPIEYPFPTWASGADESYAFPPMPPVIAPRTDEPPRLRFACWISLFEKLHALRPFEDVLVDLACADADLHRFLDRLERHWHDVIAAQLAGGADVIIFGDDWGTQTAPLISLELFDAIFAPRYRRLFDRVHAANAHVMFHSCGQLGPIFDRLLDLGINAIWPQVNLHDSDALAARLARHRVALFIHPDRQYLIPRGTPAEIDAYVSACARRHRALRGGGVFLVEIENDAPWCNVEALANAIARYR